MSLPGEPRLAVLRSIPGEGGSIGLVPGSFDPMTVAHVALAEAAAGHAILVWSPATLPKERSSGGHPEPPLLDPVRRIESLLAFAEAHPVIGVAISSHGRYVDQAEAFARTFPGARPVIAVGSDKVLQLLDPVWYDDRDAALARLFAVADIAYAARSGGEEELDRLLASEPRWAPRLRQLDVSPTLARISSRDVRRRVRAGEDVGALVPEQVRPFL